ELAIRILPFAVRLVVLGSDLGIAHRDSVAVLSALDADAGHGTHRCWGVITRYDTLQKVEAGRSPPPSSADRKPDPRVGVGRREGERELGDRGVRRVHADRDSALRAVVRTLRT